MDWKFSGSQPVYLQIMEQIQSAVISEEIGPGARIPSVRDLAFQAGVNPNTMQRALWELERDGLLIADTTGRWVTEDEKILNEMRWKRVRQTLYACAQQLQSVGLTLQEAAQLLEELEKEETEWNTHLLPKD